jgi:hypothetical protein
MNNQTMWRVILRFSLNDDKRSTWRNRLAKILQGYKVTTRDDKTSTWELEEMSAEQCSLCVAEILDKLREMSDDAASSAHLDHLWVYIDKSVPSLKKRRAKR